MPLLYAGSFAFLAALCALSVAALRLSQRHVAGERNLEFRLLLAVSGLAVGGFALAQAGMNYSWTGHPQIADWQWLRFSLIFVGSLAIAHVLLRLSKSQSSQIMLPVAAALALLGLIAVYTWEVRDANSYISTEGLPTMRHYVAEAETTALTAQQAADMRELSESMPDEVAYELDRDNIAQNRFATVLNAEWTRSYNEAVVRFRAHAIGALEQPAVSRVFLYQVTQRQLAAVVLAILLVPLWAWLFEPRRLVAMIGSTRFMVGSATLLVTLALVGVVLSRGAVPSLSVLSSDSVNTFEVIKVALVMFIASSFVWLRRRTSAPPWPVYGLLGLSVALPLFAFLLRDFGASLVLGLVTGSLLIIASSGAVRRVLMAGSVLAIFSLPAALYLTPAALSPSVRSRVETWTDPEAALRDSSESNLINSTIERMINRRVQAGTSVGGLPYVLRSDVESVLQELDWRIQALQASHTEAEPFVPVSEGVEEELLVEAETIWRAIGGYEGMPSPESIDSVTQRLAEVHGRFDVALAEFATRTAAVTQPGSLPLVGNTSEGGALPDDAAVVADLASMPRAADGFQLARASHALAAGGMFGVGLGQGRPEAIPGVTEDAALAILGEGLGFVGSVAIVLLLLALVQRGIATIGSGRPRGLDMMAAGLSLLIAAQALVAFGGLLGLLPYTGVGFPFISRSGSGILANVFVVTVLAGLPGPQLEQRIRPASAAFGFARSRRGFISDLGNAGIAACFGFFLFSLGSLQVGGRSVVPGAFLRSPVDDEQSPDSLDQWSGPLYYRALPGAILDRHGVVMAESHLDGLGWRSSDPGLAASIGHIVEPLDGLVRLKATQPDGDST